MFNKILLPIDGSRHSERACEYAINLANQYNGIIDLVYAIDEHMAQMELLSTSSKHELEQRRKQKFANIIERIEEAAIPHNVHFVRGEPGPAIVAFANKGVYDCVVIGSRGLNQLQTMVLGSVSHKVVKRVNIPVLVVK